LGLRAANACNVHRSRLSNVVGLKFRISAIAVLDDVLWHIDQVQA
jgi:predicted XRE-type DNA-binding protein